MQKKLNKKRRYCKVITGAALGQQGKILVIDYTNSRAIVEGLSINKKHVKPSASSPHGGIVR